MRDERLAVLLTAEDQNETPIFGYWPYPDGSKSSPTCPTSRAIRHEYMKSNFSKSGVLLCKWLELLNFRSFPIRLRAKDVQRYIKLHLNLVVLNFIPFLDKVNPIFS